MDLVQRLMSPDIKGKILPKERFSFFSDLSSFPKGEQLPEKTKELVLSFAEQIVKEEIPLLPAIEYMAFQRDGNRSRYESLWFGRRKRLLLLTLAEWIEGKGRFTDQMVNYVWAILEETSWIAPAHSHSGDPLPDYDDRDTRDIDLFSAETGSLLAWVTLLAGDVLKGQSALLLPRIKKQVYDRLLIPFSKISDLHWMGTEPGKTPVNNWNPWILSNFLTMIGVFCEDPQERENLCRRAMRMLACFPASYHSDGGCDEGPSYWGKAGGSLFDCCELLYDLSGGAVSLFDDPLLKAIGEYVQKAYICGDYFLNFADAPGRIQLDGALVARFGRRCGSVQLERFGAQQFWRQAEGEKSKTFSLPSLAGENRSRETLAVKSVYQPAYWSIYRELKNLFTLPSPMEAPEVPDAVYLDGVQVCVLRETHRPDQGFYLAAKGGNNQESHNHNDVGTFVVYHNGVPVFFDLGVGTYTRFTFQRETRYQIFTMNSSHHNLPEVDGVPQEDGLSHCARNASFDPGSRCFSLDIAGAYPEKAGMESWVRRFSQRGEEVLVEEDFMLDRPRQPVLHLICLEKPGFEKGKLFFSQLGVQAVLSQPFQLQVQEIPLEDQKLIDAWESTRVYRLTLSLKEKVQQGHWEMRIQRMN